jgi:hypothetical protein
VEPPEHPSAPNRERQSFWAQFLQGKTSAQRFVIALGALAAALLAIGAVVTTIARAVDNDDDRSVGPATGEVQRIENQSVEADDFVQLLLDHDGGPPLPLDHQIMGRPGPGDVSLDYNCGAATGCSTVRIQDEQVTFSSISGGVWFQGCYGVVKDGPGYGAQGLDIVVSFQGTTCV